MCRCMICAIPAEDSTSTDIGNAMWMTKVELGNLRVVPIPVTVRLAP